MTTIKRVSPVIIRRVASVTADPSSLQVFPEVSNEEPMSPYLRMKEDVERLRKKWNLNF